MKPILGAHVSVAGGLYKGIENGTAIGAECIQIFGASPRQWGAGLPSPADVKKFQDAWKASSIQSVFLHAPYLNNLASPDEMTIAKTVKNMTAHMTIANMIGATGVVFHAGSGKVPPKRKLALGALATTLPELANLRCNCIGDTMSRSDKEIRQGSANRSGRADFHLSRCLSCATCPRHSLVVNPREVNENLQRRPGDQLSLGGLDGAAAREASIKKAVVTMKEILKNSPGDTKLIIENVAGGGAKIPATPKEIGQMLELANDKRVAVCYDTAHGFEAGLIKEHTPEAVKLLWDEFDKEVGCEHLVAIHANDSKTEFNSHHDRHENIGEGFIGKKAFEYLMADKRIAHTHWFLEVPGYDGLGPDKKNMDALKKCRG